jgi:uncharacterized protein YkwD
VPRLRHLTSGARRVAASALIATPVLLAGSVSAAVACPHNGKSPSKLTPEQAEQSVTCLINKARRHNGARRLTWDVRLESAARGHSAAMDSSNFFSHLGDGSPIERVRATGYLEGASSWMVGENIHWGAGRQGSPKATVARWMSSPVHRSTMLSRSFRDIGVGVAVGSPTGGSGRNSAIYTANFGLSRQPSLPFIMAWTDQR